MRVMQLKEAFSKHAVLELRVFDVFFYLRSIAPTHMPIAAYGNVGYADVDGGWVITDAVDPQRFAEYAMDWVDAGASIIGGCCGTTPATIAAIGKLLCSDPPP